MYCSAISMRFSLGMSTPRRRGMAGLLALTLLVAGIGADDAHDAAAPHDLAVLADSADAGSDFHDSSRCWGGSGRFGCRLWCFESRMLQMRALRGSIGETS